MKNYIYLIIFAFCLCACEKEDQFVGYEEIKIEPYILENYYSDAKQLYYNEVFNDPNHPHYDEITLDTAEITKVLKIIQAVYNLSSPERDTIFSVHQIHGYYCYSFNSLILNVDTSLQEIKNLANMIMPTGESELDNLLNTYHFDSVRTAYSYPNFPWLTIYTEDEYNILPIESEFNNLRSVLMTDFSKGCVGDGNTITLSRNDQSATITFSIGKGDCPAGCTYHKYWEFEVINGKANFIRTYN